MALKMDQRVSQAAHIAAGLFTFLSRSSTVQLTSGWTAWHSLQTTSNVFPPQLVLSPLLAVYSPSQSTGTAA